MDLDTRSQEHDVISLVRDLVRELAPQRLKRGDVTLASRLDRDLGIDSLARTELILFIRPTVIKDPVDAHVIAEQMRTKMNSQLVGTSNPVVVLPAPQVPR